LLVGSRVVRLSCAVFLACAILVSGAGRADAEEVPGSWYGPGYYGPTTSGGSYDASNHTPSRELLPSGTEPELRYGGSPGHEADGQAVHPIGVADVLPKANQANGLVGYGTGSPDPPKDGSVAASDTTRGEANGEMLDNPDGLPQNGLPQKEVSQNGLPKNRLPQNGLSQKEVSQKDLTQDELPSDESTRGARFGDIAPYGEDYRGRVAQSNQIGTGAYLLMQPYGIDTGFIGSQEGFRLDAYVPDPGYSRSGVTVGMGVDIGQRSVADIQALDIPEALKQKLMPYAGLIGQDAVNFLANYPLYLTEDEAYALDQAVAQDIFGKVAALYDADATGDSFLELPPEARTVIADVAYQYGPNLEQRLPDFWGDVTQGRWDEATQTLRDFDDRYPARRNAEADLLDQAMGLEDFASYKVQPGDTLSGIASRLGISTQYLVARNGLINPDAIYSGQILYY
jgi:hypothetical protein